MFYDIFVQLRISFFFFFIVNINSRRASYAGGRRIAFELVDTLEPSHQWSAQTSPSRLEGTRETGCLILAMRFYFSHTHHRAKEKTNYRAGTGKGRKTDLGKEGK